jgi:hypothetical protein
MGAGVGLEPLLVPYLCRGGLELLSQRNKGDSPPSQRRLASLISGEKPTPPLLGWFSAHVSPHHFYEGGSPPTPLYRGESVEVNQ